MRLATTWLQFKCDWLPVACCFFWHATAGSCIQSRQFFEELFELKNEETIKKS
jgi:hypothetical protein